jgi:hypothetical protein
MSSLCEDNSPGAITGDVSQVQSDYKSVDDDIGASIMTPTSLVGHDNQRSQHCDHSVY